MSAAPLSRQALDALIEAQKASDAIGAVLGGIEDKMHANGLSGALWAIEAILAQMSQDVDAAVELGLEAQQRQADALSAS
jgi:hypothetical protein